MNALVTGAAGFVGSNLVDRLLTAGHNVIGIDNFSTGRRHFLDRASMHPGFQLVCGDTLNTELLVSCMRGVNTVFHMAANADVRFGTDHPTKDFQQNAQATLSVLEAMRICNVPAIAFASTGSVYGEGSVFPSPENHPFPIQTSLYGASKLAAEGLIQAYAEGFGIRACIFRFVSLLGDRYSHGHVIDFYRQLTAHPGWLKVLGDGNQRKSYLHVHDCVEAILVALERAEERVSIFNLGTNEYCTVKESIAWICEELRHAPKIEYSGGSRGWIGDSPFIFLDCARIQSLGWSPRYTIRDSVLMTVRYLRDNSHLLDSSIALG